MIILGTNSIKDTGYDVANSCRFNQPDNPYLTRTISSAGSTTTISISFWFKRGKLTDDLHLFSSNSFDEIKITGSDTLRIESYTGGYNYRKITNRLFRDPSAWQHILVVFDTSNSTADDRIRLYINGVRETSFSTSQNPSQNFAMSYFGTAHPFIIATDARTLTGASNLDGYLSEVVALDGSALDPTSFGEFDSDSPTIWKPIDVSGLTFGTNGFYLDFEDSSALGADVSGNTNNFTVNNLTAIDQSTDTCTNNFATLNPLAKGSSSTFSEGNLKETVGSATYNTSTSTIGVSSGKWYWEYKLPASSLNYVLYGITTVEFSANSSDVMTNFKTSYSKTAYANEFRYNTAGGSYSTDTSGFSTDSTGDIVKIALDLDNNFIYVGNGSSWFNSGNPESGASGTGASKAVVAGLTYFPMMIVYNNSMEINFGSPPYSESGGNSDGDGYGNFNQAVPSGYYSLNSKNLSEYG